MNTDITLKEQLNIVDEDILISSEKTNKLKSIISENNFFVDSNQPDIIKMLSLFDVSNGKYSSTSIKGFYLFNGASLISKEYVKFDDNNVIVYIKTINNNVENKIAIAKINKDVFISIEGTEKVFAVENQLLLSFGVIKKAEFINFCDSLEKNDIYKLSEIDNVYLADAPYPIYFKDTTFTRTADYVGFYISFGSLLKFDLTNLNNINVDGVSISLIDIDMSNENKIKKMLTNKSYGYGSMLVSQERLLSYLMKRSKEFVLKSNEFKDYFICTEDLLLNVKDKGIMGITYDDMLVYDKMYIPAFDYTEAKTNNVVGSAILFKFKDEYIWMMYDKDNKRMCFMTYKGDVFNNNNVKVMSNLVLTKVNYVNEDNFVLFTGFPNLVNNSVIDIYFDSSQEIVDNGGKKFAIDINSFDSFYANAVSNFTDVFMSDDMFFWSNGSNKYIYDTGVLLRNLKTYIKHKEHTLIDNKEKMVFLNKNIYYNMCIANENNNFNISINSYAALLKNEVDRKTGNTKNISSIQDKETLNIAKAIASYFSFTVSYQNNEWITFEHNNSFLTKKIDTNVVVEYIHGYLTEMIDNQVDNILNKLKTGAKIDYISEARVLAATVSQYIDTMKNTAKFLIESNVTKKVDNIWPDKEYEFVKVSDDFFVNNIPNSEIANHCVLNKKAFDKEKRRFYDTKFSSQKNKFFSSNIFYADYKDIEDKVVLNNIVDNTGALHSFIFKDIGIIYSNAIGNVDGMDISPKIILKNHGLKTINEEDMYVFELSFGYDYSIEIKNIINDNNFPDKELASSVISDYQKEYDNKLKNIDFTAAKDKSPIFNVDLSAVAELNIKDYIPVIDGYYIAWKNGKFLVSIGGQEWYSPYYGNNGIVLNNNIHINNSKAIELKFQELILSNKHVAEINGEYKEKDIVDLNQLRLHKVEITNIDLNKMICDLDIKVSFVDICAVISDELKKPKEQFKISLKQVSLSVINKNKGLVLISEKIYYKAIMELTKDIFNNKEDILNNQERCYTFEYNFNLVIQLEMSNNYIYDTKTEAINNKVFMFFKGTEDE